MDVSAIKLSHDNNNDEQKLHDSKIYSEQRAPEKDKRFTANKEVEFKNEDKSRGYRKTYDANMFENVLDNVEMALVAENGKDCRD